MNRLRINVEHIKTDIVLMYLSIGKNMVKEQLLVYYYIRYYNVENYILFIGTFLSIF